MITLWEHCGNADVSGSGASGLRQTTTFLGGGTPDKSCGNTPHLHKAHIITKSKNNNTLWPHPPTAAHAVLMGRGPRRRPVQICSHLISRRLTTWPGLKVDLIKAAARLKCLILAGVWVHPAPQTYACLDRDTPPRGGPGVVAAPRTQPESDCHMCGEFSAGNRRKVQMCSGSRFLSAHHQKLNLSSFTV